MGEETIMIKKQGEILWKLAKKRQGKGKNGKDFLGKERKRKGK
jgi:hypothetical protein